MWLRIEYFFRHIQLPTDFGLKMQKKPEKTAPLINKASESKLNL